MVQDSFTAAFDHANRFTWIAAPLATQAIRTELIIQNLAILEGQAEAQAGGKGEPLALRVSLASSQAGELVGGPRGLQVEAVAALATGDATFQVFCAFNNGG